MATAPIMPFYTDAYLADTHHLSTEQHGAYLLLLLYCWRHNGVGLPHDDAKLARIARLSLRRWLRMREALLPFFELRDGLLYQKRLMTTWGQVHAKIEVKREQGKRSAQKRADVVNVLKDNVVSAANAQQSTKPCSDESLSSLKEEAIRSNYGVCERVTLPCPQVSFLTPYLTNLDYVATRGVRKKLPEHLRERVAEAVEEVTRCVQPIAPLELEAIADVFFQRYPAVKAAQRQPLRDDFVRSLSAYPADMLHAVMQQVLVQHTQAYPPLLGSLIALLEPQMQTRKFLYKNVMILRG